MPRNKGGLDAERFDKMSDELVKQQRVGEGDVGEVYLRARSVHTVS
jgi:hypothetical protein